MAIDAITLTAVVGELEGELRDSRIDKIQQPERDVLLFTLRTRNGNRKLLVSAGTGSARIHFTSVSRENPMAPPMFCMLLRKHLTGAKIKRLEQPYLERMCTIVMDGVDSFGEQAEKRLVVEMMGRNSNIILCDSEGHIIDCLRRVFADDSDKRQVMPGMFYRLPPAETKNDPFSVTQAEIGALEMAAEPGMALDKWLVDTFRGLSPLIAREASVCCAGATDAVIGNATELSSKLRSFFDRFMSPEGTAPYIVYRNDKPSDVCCIPIAQYDDQCKRMDSYSEMLDELYTLTEQSKRMGQRSQMMVKSVKNLRDRSARKLTYQREELLQTEGRERVRQLGDIIQANLHRMISGAKSLIAEDFYTDGQPMIEIPLEPKLSPRQNAEKYYKNYTKQKNASVILKEQIKHGEKELDYLESVLEELKRAAGEKDLGEIRAELIAGGYIRERDAKKTMKRQPNAPLRFVSSSGIQIMVGRNNIQNDALTFKTAMRSDMWLHVQKLHGAHVIISENASDIDDNTLAEAAALAALYSEGKNAGAVDVDYAPVRFVKKPSGAKPGMVIYTNYRTIRVKPDETLAERLKK